MRARSLVAAFAIVFGRVVAPTPVLAAPPAPTGASPGDLKDFASAYDAYQTLLAKYGASMSAADKRSIQHAIDELATLTGTIRIAVAEPGATVALDDQDVGT